MYYPDPAVRHEVVHYSPAQLAAKRRADGDKAVCAGMPTCRVATPYCEGDFVVSYTALCFEGCVRKKDCGP